MASILIMLGLLGLCANKAYSAQGVAGAHSKIGKPLVFVKQGHDINFREKRKTNATPTAGPIGASTISMIPSLLDFTLYGYTKEVYCRSRGNPTPVVNWLRNGVPVTSNPSVNVHQSDSSDETYVSKTLTVKMVDVADGGSYVCQVAKNSVGGELTLTLNVTVQPNLTISTTAMDAKNGETQSVSCVSSGNPTPSIKWTREGVPAYCCTSGSYSQTNVVEAYTVTSTLNITATEATVGGVYYCEAYNGGLLKTKQVKLTVPQPPINNLGLYIGVGVAGFVLLCSAIAAILCRTKACKKNSRNNRSQAY